jgi:SSS family solute:Na+ symporter
VTSLTLRAFVDSSTPRGFATNLIVTTGVTTIVWLVVTMLTKPEPEATLAAFYQRVRPAGPGWRRFGTRGSGELWRNAAMWAAGMVLVYSIMFATGAAIFGDAQKLRLFGSMLVVSAIALFVMLRRDRDPSPPGVQPIRE